MINNKATAIAHPNIALIKYWGNRDHELRIPENGSISFNLGGLSTKTTVEFDQSFEADSLEINGIAIENSGLKRVSNFLELIRKMAEKSQFARVTSENNFPIGAGVASSAAGFAALSLAATKAFGLDLSELDLSRLARRGSGSACRSIPPGFVEWVPGRTDSTSYAYSIAPPDYWDLVDIVTIVMSRHKDVGSTAGHALARTSPIHNARVADAARRLDIGKDAILKRDFDALADIVELDSNLMHAVMMTSSPALVYLEPATISIIKAIPEWRHEGIPVCYTLDAGPNVHVICEKAYVDFVKDHLNSMNGIEKVLVAPVGGGTELVS